MTLQDDVSALKDGDYVRAVFECGKEELIYTSKVSSANSYQIMTIGTILPRVIRWADGSAPLDLTSVTVIDPPLPPEPEVGSFARLKDESIALHEVENENTPDANGSGWTITNDENWYSWAEIYPQIKKLWSPSGEEITL